MPQVCHSKNEEHSNGYFIGYREAIVNLTSNFYSFYKIIMSETSLSKVSNKLPR